MGIVNQSETGVAVPRLSEVLFERTDRSFGSMAALPSNVEAIEAALVFSARLSSLVAIVGPSGCGKTHLLEAVAFRMRRDTGEPVYLRSALEFLDSGARAESPVPLLLDDVQEVLTKPKYRLLLRVALERRVRAARPTLLSFTMPRVSRQVKAFLPASREWTVAAVLSPEPAERVLLLNQLAAAEGLSLSPGLVRIIATQMHGNGRTLAGALKRLRLSGTTWLDARSTVRACGLLEPFFADNSNWDLRLKILRAADASRAQFSRVSPLDLAIYTMLREAALCEADVARAVGAEPADVYLRASRFQKDIESDPTVANYVRQFVEIVVAALSAD